MFGKVKTDSCGVKLSETIKIPVLACPRLIEVHAEYPLHGLSDESHATLDLLRLSSRTFLSTDEVERTKEALWCDDACMLRYLRATKFILADAERKLNNTLIWRREFQPSVMSDTDIAAELATGKVYLNGFDKQGHPLLHMILRRDNTGDFERSLRYSIYMMEKAFALAPPGVEKLCILVDFLDNNSGQLSDTKRWVDILSSHYPERLGHSMLINTSWVMTALLKMIYAFLDPVTKAKLHIVDLKDMREEMNADDIRHWVDESELDVSLGGSFNFEFDIVTYLPHFLAAPRP